MKRETTGYLMERSSLDYFSFIMTVMLEFLWKFLLVFTAGSLVTVEIISFS